MQNFDFVKTDDQTKKLFEYLVKMKSPLARRFFEERQEAQQMFDNMLADL